MAWIKISEDKIVNTDNIVSIEIRQTSGSSCRIYCVSKEGSYYRSERFNSYKECLEMLSKLWDAMRSNKSIDINEERNTR